uniref:Uncharacterized protein n=1 Tax=Ditylenchus dipsaci TaxID=166011 RepID=A0A915CS02_9BILA
MANRGRAPIIVQPENKDADSFKKKPKIQFVEDQSQNSAKKSRKPVPIDVTGLQTDTELYRSNSASKSVCLDGLTFTPSLSPAPLSRANSPSMKSQSNLVYPKRRYSTARRDSLQDMETPVFTTSEIKLRKKTPSSPKTVLTLAGLFVCGLMLFVSGLIVVINQKEFLFLLTGSIFLLVGLAMLTICLILQRKNVFKYFVDMNRDLHWLKIGDSYIGRMFVVEPDDSHLLPIPPPTPFSLAK